MVVDLSRLPQERGLPHHLQIRIETASEFVGVRAMTGSLLPIYCGKLPPNDTPEWTVLHIAQSDPPHAVRLQRSTSMPIAPRPCPVTSE